MILVNFIAFALFLPGLNQSIAEVNPHILILLMKMIINAFADLIYYRFIVLAAAEEVESINHNDFKFIAVIYFLL